MQCVATSALFIRKLIEFRNPIWIQPLILGDTRLRPRPGFGSDPRCIRAEFGAISIPAS
jgi:hypothetical protein